MLIPLLITPFGFVLEWTGDGCFALDEGSYTVLLDGVPLREDTAFTLAFWGLAPDRDYVVELRGALAATITVHTEAAGFVLDARDYGAAGDGSANDTAAIAAALYTAPAGAVVRLGRGEYRVDHVLLRSGVDLYLEEGAVLRQSSDRSGLAILKGYQKDCHHREARINASWEGHPLDCWCSLVYGRNVSDVRIYGPGTLDGGGAEGGWWERPKEKQDGGFRPRNLTLVECENITVCGIVSRNSAAWNLHPLYSKNLRFLGLRVESDPASPNTDGLNPESCEAVEIAGCDFAVGDDCIAVKAGKFYMSRRHLRPSRDIRIRGCRMRQGHGGVVLGSELSCGIRDVVVEKCLFEGTDRGLRIKTRRGRGDTAVVDGVTFRDVRMRGVVHPFVVNMFYHCDPDGHSDYVRSKAALPVTDETPAVRGICLEQVDADGIAGCGIFVYGLPERPVDGVSVRDCRFAFAPGHRTAAVGQAAMMDDPVEIPGLGVFLENVEEEILEGNTFEGDYVAVIGGEEAVL